MKLRRSIATAAIICAAAALTTPSAAIANPGMDAAEKVRKLDIMLMVTSLRCRTGEHDFREEYQAFTRQNLHHLNRAYSTMRSNLSARYGHKGSKRALDRVSVQMANQYGNGHPWLGCAELKQVVTKLGTVREHAQLSSEASRLLGPRQLVMNAPQ